MRLLITSYQKSGTHQIMPIFMDIMNIQDKCHYAEEALLPYLGHDKKVDYGLEGIRETAHDLATFQDRAFGHICYRPEYVEALQSQPTKVLFNIRDPRDIIVAEYKRMEWYYEMFGHHDVPPLWDWEDKRTGNRIFLNDDTITDLIHFASLRWPYWLGWLEHDWVLPVRYEGLRLHSLETCQKIHEWLIPEVFVVEPDEMVKRARPRTNTQTFRRGIPGEWILTFEDHHVKLAKKLLGDIIKELGYKI